MHVDITGLKGIRITCMCELFFSIWNISIIDSLVITD